jgi:hypothetical protein
MDAAQLRTFGTKYTAAWCSHEAVRVAALYAENGAMSFVSRARQTARIPPVPTSDAIS